MRAAHTPNFATSVGCSMWPGLEPRPTSNSELGFEAVLNSSLSPKVVMLPPDLGVLPYCLP